MAADQQGAMFMQPAARRVAFGAGARDVTSGDAHPISASFVFSIGAPSAVTGVVPGAARNDVAGLMLGITRGGWPHINQVLVDGRALPPA